MKFMWCSPCVWAYQNHWYNFIEKKIFRSQCTTDQLSSIQSNVKYDNYKTSIDTKAHCWRLKTNTKMPVKFDMTIKDFDICYMISNVFWFKILWAGTGAWTTSALIFYLKIKGTCVNSPCI